MGQRIRIVLLTGFFTFAFALLFFALVQNYAQAATPSLPMLVQTKVKAPVRIVATIDTDGMSSPIDNTIVPSFGVEHHQTAGFDFDSDDSFQKYLNTDHPFDDSTYTPTDLLPIDSNFTANNSKTFKLRAEAGTHFADLAWHFRNAFSGDKLYISSAWRSVGFQNYLIKQGCSLFKCASIGTSEHQAGLALDLKVITKGGKGYSLDAAYPNKYSDWLKANAADYGFHNTYQKGVEIDGKIVEGRHRRYLGTELAKLLADNNQTFAEYYKTITN
ncbi:MAG: D-alanyl-D-alanine carboxypeptidase family protein [candidate division SR1 bacterium]|nr:D-alanyl-D-alanine carboxypeptidase family protein [candidate division SR1 bacterium]